MLKYESLCKEKVNNFFFMKKISEIFFAVFILFANSFSQTTTNDEWQTYFEKSGYLETPRYDETMEYFSKHRNTD